MSWCGATPLTQGSLLKRFSSFFQKGKTQGSKNKAAPCGTALYFCRLFAQIEALVETINAAAGIYQLLLAGKEGMALGADFYADLGDGGDGLQRITAGAANHSRAILGMDAFFHAISPLSNSWRQC
mgnify:FL=1|jgi:hypothetical protein